MSSKKTLSPKERRFVDAYLGSANGVGSKAAIAAGYAKGSARVTASQLLTKPNVAKAVLERQAKEEQASIANAQERDERLSKIVRKGDDQAAIRAASEMNKCDGRHSIKHEITGRVKLEQILTNSLGDE